jgi:ubiquinol-cytochrome c reductase cytochrome c1 subunit
VEARLIALAALLWLLAVPSAWAVEAGHECGEVECDPVRIDLGDRPSLQRGARIFVNYCLSCHSASYMRYERMGRDLGISEELVRENLLFAAEQVGDLMQAVMSAEDATDWFGTAPPDLSLVTRYRDPEWVYTFLRGFYRDDDSPSGWNNVVFPNVAMPHVLYEWQGEQRPRAGAGEPAGRADDPPESHGGDSVTARLELVDPGTLSPQEYDLAMRDLTNFLVYVGEPAKLVRYRIGLYVLIFLAVFLFFAWLLKKEYWKDIH